MNYVKYDEIGFDNFSLEMGHWEYRPLPNKSERALAG